MTKTIHRKTVLRDGKEETEVTEDTFVEQDNIAPEELQSSLQKVIDQFVEGSDDLGNLPVTQ